MSSDVDRTGTGPLAGVSHRHVVAGGLRFHLAEQGEGPLVLLLHGWPESWYSWRHQFSPLAEAGHHVVAPDQRGYGSTDAPRDVEAYTLLHLVGDVVALVDELGYTEAVVVGHDWGAVVGWVAAMLRPDVVRGVAGLSVPPLLPSGMPSLAETRAAFGPGFYLNHVQQRGIVDAELAADPTATLRRILVAASAQGLDGTSLWLWVVPEGASLLDTVPEPDALPAWLTGDDVAAFAADFSHRGDRAFTGPLDWYRNIERNRELLAPFTGLGIGVPGLFVVGDHDMTASSATPQGLRKAVLATVPRLHDVVVLPGCGHWTQQERPDEVNAALLGFLPTVSESGSQPTSGA